MIYCLGGKARSKVDQNGVLPFRTRYFRLVNANEVSVQLAFNCVSRRALQLKISQHNEKHTALRRDTNSAVPLAVSKQ